MEAGEIHHIEGNGEVIECPYCRKKILLKSFENDKDIFEIKRRR